jgi:uncharacterized membrane protein YheB (UPF0754 family)
MHFNKGNTSNLISFALLVGGVWAVRAAMPLGSWVLAAGLFGFAGGVTNWLAVKMLFDRVPLLYGSGVIPARFREIRATIKTLIMTHFFDEDYLRRFFASGNGGLMPSGAVLEEKLTLFIDSDEVERGIVGQLEELQETRIGPMIKLAGLDVIKTLIKDFLNGLVPHLAPRLAAFGAQSLDIGALRRQVDQLLSAKLEELTPEKVKQMMEEVMREHLGWLIVWGNIFGGAIGLLSHALGY